MFTVSRPPQIPPTCCALVEHADGTKTQILSSANTDVARGAALVTATAALASGERILIGPGNFSLAGSLAIPSNTVVQGSGYGTHLYIPNTTNASFQMVKNLDTTNGNTNISLIGVRLDGNNSNNSSGTQKGVFFVKVVGFVVRDCWIEHLGRAGTPSCIAINPTSSTDGLIHGNIITDTVDGINTSNGGGGASCARLSVMCNEVISTNRDYGINAFGVDDSVFSGNVLRSTSAGINIDTANRCIFSNNVVAAAGSFGIAADNCTGILLIGNHVQGVTGVSSHAISIGSGATDTGVIGNFLKGGSTGTTLSDGGTTTTSSGNLT